MRLSTLRDGTPDGRLVAVEGATCRPVAGWRMQDALDADATAAEIEGRLGDPEPFDHAQALAPLPRAFQFLDGSAYLNHVELVRKARGAEMPARLRTEPLMYQGGSDGFLAPTDPITGDPDWGIDFEGEIAVITGFVPRGADRARAAEAIRYVMLCNDISLRGLIPEELAKGFGFVQSKPASAFSPLAVAVERCPGWRDGRLHGVLRVDLNGAPFGRLETGPEMSFDFPTLIAHAAKTRDLAAGTIIGSGTVSNRGVDGGPGAPVAEGGAGYACIAEQRMVETILHGGPRTPFLRPGDRMRIRMEDGEGRDIFGAIDQEVRA